MESSYEWYQLVVAYGIGILLIIMWLFFSKEMKDYLDKLYKDNALNILISERHL